MKSIFTTDDFKHIQNEEKELKRLIFNFVDLDKNEPSKKVLSSIFAYSQALSIRKSDYLDEIELILN